MNILLIKLGALGDVLRTTPLLTALNKKYPEGRVTWLVDPRHREVLEGNPLIHEILNYSKEGLDRLKKEMFDVAINLDKEEEALEAITAARAGKKMGFGSSAEGRLWPLGSLSDYAYRLGIDDDLKFRRNKKSYQEVSFEQVGLSFSGEEYLFSLGEDDTAFSRNCLGKLGVDLDARDRPIIGLNTGSGQRFAGKKLPVASWVRLAEMFYRQMNARVFLLGGEEEVERNRQIQKLSPVPVIHTGSHSIKRFAAIVRECDLVVSGDTTAMHIAIAVKVPVIAYFASTCSAEIELYGRGKKIVSEIGCSPCYLKVCPIDEQCMKDMEPSVICRAAEEVLKETGVLSA